MTLIHEFEALIWAMEGIQARNINCQTFEMDNTTLVEILQHPSEWTAFYTMLEDFEALINNFTNFRIS
ncbi:unnamed protein product [Cochlearia groenlandica]